MLANGLAKQVQKMHYESGYTPEQIAESLKLDVGLVTHALIQAPESRKTVTSKELLSKYVKRAAEVIGEKLEEIEYPRIQLEAAKFVMEVEMGKHDPPQKAETINNQTIVFNTVLQQANSAYDEQLREAGLIPTKQPQQHQSKEPIEV